MDAAEIRRLRQQRGWTQAELAERLATDAVTVSRWERGASNPRPSSMARLRELLSAATPAEALRSAVGRAESERILRRALLLERRPRPRRFVADPTRRIRQVERARAEQRALNAAMRTDR